uniref:Uncharacterized protein n=1 Tax=Arundo donax TaxID=35708 RepID=A0A0A9FL19_ARUDO
MSQKNLPNRTPVSESDTDTRTRVFIKDSK